MKNFFPGAATTAFLVFLAFSAFAAPPSGAGAPRPAVTNAPLDTAARARELEAEIARRTQAYKQRLRRKLIAGDNNEPRFERYLADFRRKIACSAFLNYPEAARGKTYGDMVITVSVLADGSFENARVARSSGHKVLDAGAIDIARLAAPYMPFPPEIRVDTDALDITRTWTFTSTQEEAPEDPCA
ncbi:MAG: energy transducer TonB [Azoarcus sp.]|jgi:protein TonB|nr:energy transducer TonB [Azoarcus sp.]